MALRIAYCSLAHLEVRAHVSRTARFWAYQTPVNAVVDDIRECRRAA
jgi:hypothetical protein